ncbi:sugar phosphate isomerase/epimerase family protein [Bremerella sp.]|uniref:sugar phosphate isomerase/epimerase family protein n=1 Tax=Bremerella sp. TaxID=2795602 RepID=UPI00391C87ED
MQLLASSVATLALSSAVHANERILNRTGMGLVIYDCNIRRNWMREQQPGFDLFEPLTFLKHCHALGAGGMQADLGVMTAQEIDTLRSFAEQHGLFIDAIVKPPRGDDDIRRFEDEIRTARDVGVQAARTTIIPGRRYERFTTLAEFSEFERRGRAMLERAAPIVEKCRVPFAVENHKDQRLDERLALLNHIDSEFVGACIDTGNSFALLDGTYEPIEVLAPYAFTVHLKDQALQPYPEGFLLGDIPLGQGSFDLKRMVESIRKVKPDIRFALELITRDPLRVPCLTEAYYATMPTAAATDLAQTLRFVQRHPTTRLQEVSSLPVASQVKLEDENVAASIAFAGQQLGI